LLADAQGQYAKLASETLSSGAPKSLSGTVPNCPLGAVFFLGRRWAFTRTRLSPGSLPAKLGSSPLSNLGMDRLDSDCRAALRPTPPASCRRRRGKGRDRSLLAQRAQGGCHPLDELAGGRGLSCEDAAAAFLDRRRPGQGCRRPRAAPPHCACRCIAHRNRRSRQRQGARPRHRGQIAWS
jgi:hypothetical protein